MSSRAGTMLRLLALLGAVVTLTALTQISGVALLVSILAARLLRSGALAAVLLFVTAYLAMTIALVPPLAALGGRIPLPCTGEPLRALPIVCALNRHYVEPRLLTLADRMATDVAAEYPGSVTVALDANFPFLDGFPLLPHLSHDDGLKLDLGYFYSDRAGAYLPGATRSPIGYWAFETPAPGEDTDCSRTWLTARWDMEWLQPLFPQIPLEPERTRFALHWLFQNGPSHGLERVFVEPYLARRLGVSSPLLGFQGCRAARHDDHIHLQVR
jgi:hypothetical protein